MVRNIGHEKLIKHLDSQKICLTRHIQRIFSERLDLLGLYDLLQSYPDDHIEMMARSFSYLRLAIERGADLRQKNTSGWSALEIVCQLFPESARRNKELILKQLSQC